MDTLKFDKNKARNFVNVEPANKSEDSDDIPMPVLPNSTTDGDITKFPNLDEKALNSAKGNLIGLTDVLKQAEIKNIPKFCFVDFSELRKFLIKKDIKKRFLNIFSKYLSYRKFLLIGGII